MNVLIVRTSALGDVVHALPVLAALRRGLPRARIGWVVEERFAPLLAGHPQIDELLVVRLRAWRRRPFAATVRREVGAARAALRRFGADVALELMGNHKGGILARWSGARRIVGPSRPYRREKSSALWINEPVDAPGPHAIDRALDLLPALGLDRAPVDLGGGQLPRDDAGAEASLGRRPAPFVAIQAGAGWGNKTYPAAWWGRVARGIRDRTGIEARVPVAPGEEDLAREVVAASGGAARTVDAGPLPLLTALLARSRLVLGGDTGPVHLAHALGTPVVCVLGPTDPERNGPYGAAAGGASAGGAAAGVLWHRLPCSNCYRRFAEPKACLLTIPPAAVTERAVELLETGPGEAGLAPTVPDACPV